MWNIPGIRTDRKIVVFESDDWGSTRINSKETLDKIKRNQLLSKINHYDLFDSLETSEDLEHLFNLLSDIKTDEGRNPVFTFNMVMGNPDFTQIRSNNFEHYTFELLANTYQRIEGKNNLLLLNLAIKAGFIVPQFHAKEHLNVTAWLKALQQNDTATHQAFDLEYYGLSTTAIFGLKHYLAAYHCLNEIDLAAKKISLKDGLALFKSVFGIESTTFIACNYVWPSELESIAKDNGVNIFQGQRAQLNPSAKDGSIEIKRHYTGEKNVHNQYYTVRNCFFEPAMNPDKDWVGACMRDIENAFFWKKPAIISSHRVNYVGTLSDNNRSNNLKLLKSLLVRINKKWPEVEFLATPTLINLFR